jgi:hypothetical protein
MLFMAACEQNLCNNFRQDTIYHLSIFEVDNNDQTHCVQILESPRFSQDYVSLKAVFEKQ